MDFERGLLRMIDEYIFDAMAATGTRRAPRPPPPDQQGVTPDPEPDAASTLADDDDLLGCAIIIDEKNADADLLAQVSQQLADSTMLEPLSRERAARGSMFEFDDEITNIIPRPDLTR
jgi:hypothetical protein